MKSSRHFLKFFFVAAVIAALPPSPLFACAACGSANSNTPSSPLTDGMNLGILTLFVVIAGVLGSIAAFFVFIIRRENALAKTESSQNLSEVEV